MKYNTIKSSKIEQRKVVALAPLWAVLLFSLPWGGVAVTSSFFAWCCRLLLLSFVVLPSPAPWGGALCGLSSTRSFLGVLLRLLFWGAAVLCSFEMK